MRNAPSHHDRSAPSAVATDRVPEARSASRSTRALAMANAAPASTAIGTSTAKKPGGRSRGADPAVDRQQRDTHGEGQPRPGCALRPEVIGHADPEDDDRECKDRRTRRRAESETEDDGGDHDASGSDHGDRPRGGSACVARGPRRRAHR